MRFRSLITAVFVSPMLISCVGIPDGMEAVKGFELQRYLGTWYEIARLDHSFERGLTDVTASYSLRDDGGVKVVNRGFDTDGQTWKQAEGKAYFVEAPSLGRLKVSFFGPFYSGYNIIELDRQNYGYVMIAGSSRSYLWILSRRPSLAGATLERLLDKARDLGFDTDKLIYVGHDRAG